ncbi:unnamed protein product [Closterium sp. NIES-53]
MSYTLWTSAQLSCRTTLAALGFAPSTADPSLFLCTDTSLPPFYVLVYVDDLVFATADTEALTLVKSKLQKRHTCTDLGELRSYLGLQITRDRARRTITLTQSHMVHQSVEPSGPYPELVGCLMYLMTCTRPDLAYPLSLPAHYVAPVLLTGHADTCWVDDSATQRSSQGYTFSLGSGSVSWQSTRSSSVLSSSSEVEIYAGAMAAQELRWLTYLLFELGEQPRLPPVLYVDNKATIALCQEHRLEHRAKHIALGYFLAQELQQRGQLRLAYVATRANTADVFTKALPPGDHQRFATVLGLLALLFLTGVVTTLVTVQTMKFRFCLYFFADLLAEINALNKFLQRKKVDITLVHQEVDRTIGVIRFRYVEYVDIFGGQQAAVAIHRTPWQRQANDPRGRHGCGW